MKISHRLLRMIDGLPDGAMISLPVEAVRDWLSENGSGDGLDQDLTVEGVATLFNRSPVTVRAWIRTKQLRAYRFQGKEYRITESALADFQREQRG